MSAQDKIKIDGMAAFVKTPTITLSHRFAPKDTVITLYGSSINYILSSGTHAKTDWKVCIIEDDNETVVWSKTINSANTNTVIPRSTLNPGTYYCFVRYYDSSTQSYSFWSEGISLVITDIINNISWK